MENSQHSVLLETCFMTLPQEMQVCNVIKDPVNFHRLSDIEYAAQFVFSSNLRFHYALKQRAKDNDLIFFIIQFFAMHNPPILSLYGKEKIRHYTRAPIRIFESENGMKIFRYIQSKLSRILTESPYSVDPRYNPMNIYRGALKINKILRNGQKLVI